MYTQTFRKRLEKILRGLESKNKKLKNKLQSYKINGLIRNILTRVVTIVSDVDGIPIPDTDGYRRCTGLQYQRIVIMYNIILLVIKCIHHMSRKLYLFTSR